MRALRMVSYLDLARKVEKPRNKIGTLRTFVRNLVNRRSEEERS